MAGFQGNTTRHLPVIATNMTSHATPCRYTPVAVSCSLHFTPLWTLIIASGLDHENIQLLNWNRYDKVKPIKGKNEKYKLPKSSSDSGTRPNPRHDLVV